MPPIGRGPLIIREYIWSGIKKTFTFWVNGIERITVRMGCSCRRRCQWSALSRENLNGEKIQPADAEVGCTSSHSGGTQGCKGFGAIPGMVRACPLLKPSHRLLPFLKQPLSDPCSSSPRLPNPSSTFKISVLIHTHSRNPTNFLLHDLACNLSHMFRKHSLFNTYHAFSVIIYIFLLIIKTLRLQICLRVRTIPAY